MIVLAALLSGCDKIQAPVRDTPPPSLQDTIVKKVLVEDFTGHLCGHCPAAARMLNDTLKPMYGNRLVILSVHAGYFAQTCPPHTYPPHASYPAYSTDFNTPAGTQWFNDFNIQFSPNGMINRIKVGSSYAIPPGQWASRINLALQAEPVVGIKLSPTYEPTARLLTLTAEVKVIKTMTGDYNLVAGITEDNIIDWQLDYQINPAVPPHYQNNPNYVHRHVFRGAINGMLGYGDPVISGNASAGTVVTRVYTYSLPVQWKEDNCSVVAFLYHVSTKEVVQAEEARIK
jgi:hypothetical protein